MKFVFGGTPPVVKKVDGLGFFDATFDGSETHRRSDCLFEGAEYFRPARRGLPTESGWTPALEIPLPTDPATTFGLPSMAQTEADIREIADSKLVDVISLGIDQDAQENIFHPERQDKRRFGAGGVPVRSAEDYRRLYEATRSGNYPLMRTYSGTDDFIRLAGNVC